MSRRITLIQGHPDPAGGHYGHALAERYQAAAEAGGHTLRSIQVARLDFPLVAGKEDWENGRPPQAIVGAQEHIRWAQHLVFFYPLWLGTMPAVLKGFLEQALRPGFAVAPPQGPAAWRKLLAGRSARIVVTMGMPALVYRWYFRAHSLKSFERNILAACGIAPVRETLIGWVEGMGDAKRRRWLHRLEVLGRDGR